MFKSYCTIALRLFTRRTVYSFINVLGLGIAIAFSLLVFLFIHDEQAFDQFHKDKERTYLLKVRMFDQSAYSQGEPNPYVTLSVLSNGLGEALRSDIPDVQASTQIKSSFGVLQIGDEVFEQAVQFVDASFFDVLTFPVKSGSTKGLFTQPDDVVISETVALKYFGNTQVAGQALTLRIADVATTEYIIKAVIDVPAVSSLQPEVMIPMDSYPYYGSKGWNSYNYNTFVKLRPEASAVAFKTKVDTLIVNNRSAFVTRVRKENSLPVEMPVEELMMTPIGDIHFDKDARLNVPASDRRYAWILSGIALLIIVIASINYISFALASAANRRKEIGIRKTVGASGREIFSQFNSEAIMLATIAAVVGLSIAILCLPGFNALTEKTISFNTIPFGQVAGVLILLAMILGFLSGSYPAFYVASFRPSQVLRSAHTVRTRLMKPLVILQFALSAFLMMSGIIMYRQMHFIATTDLGFNDSAVIAVPTNLGWEPESDKAIKRFRQHVQGNAFIENVSGTVSSFAKGYNGQTFAFHEQEIMVYMNKADEHYLSLLDVPLLQGRNFQAGNPADSNAVIVNETLVKKFQLTDPLNEVLKPSANSRDWLKIIGVMKDFHFAPLDKELEPLLLKGPEGDMYFITLMVKLKSENIPEALAVAQKAWKELYPDKPFNYSFIDDDIAAQYKSYTRWMAITGVATTMAIVIASLGLFGLAGIQAANRTKEMGIRKVLGADTSSLFLLLNKPFVNLAIIAFIIATPASWYAMNQWMTNFKYHVTIGWELFAMSAISGLLVALISVSYHGFKTVNVNPAETLKCE